MTKNLCSVENCTKEVTVRKRGLCMSHFQAWARANKPNGERLCDAPNCEANHYAKGYCRVHYSRMRKRGDLSLPVSPLPKCQHHPERDATSRRSGLCPSCYARKWRGQPGPAKPQRDSSYWGAHKRVYAQRGLAKSQDCCVAGCMDGAYDWALKHDAEFLEVETLGSQQGREFSMNPFDYQPMCRPHHKRYDGDYRREQKAAS